MLRLFRRRRLSARPPLAETERVIAWAGAAGDGVVVATNLGLWLPIAGGFAPRLGWDEIHKVTWSGRALQIVPAHEVATRDGHVEMADDDPVSITLLDPDRIPEQVRARVDRSIAYTRHHRLPDGGVRVVARRVPGRDGLRWTVRYDPGTGPAPEQVAGLVEQGRTAITGGESVIPAG
jgi:hypothetical protein